MKKIILALSLILMLFFIGCAAEIPTYEGQTTTANTVVTTDGVKEVYYYDYNNFEFSNISDKDLISYITNDTDDFYIAMSGDYSDYLEDVDEETISRLFEVVNLNNKVTSLRYLLEKSASDLNEYATEVGITLTVEDIVGFYELKNNASRIYGQKSIRLETYISSRLDRSLTTDEELGLRVFEEVYYFLLNELDDYDYTSKAFLDIVSDLDSEGYAYTPEELDSIEVGFNLLIEVYN